MTFWGLRPPSGGRFFLSVVQRKSIREFREINDYGQKPLPKLLKLSNLPNLIKLFTPPLDSLN